MPTSAQPPLDPQHVPLRRPRDWEKVARDLRPIYTAVNAGLAATRFTEFISYLGYDIQIRNEMNSAIAIESPNARYRRALRVRGHFPSEQAALKRLYLVTRSLDPAGKGRVR